MGAGTARAAWQEIAQLLSLQGKPEPASANVLSEHEIEGLDQMTPQNQAQLLLERSINHYHGANDQIVERVDRWRGRIKLDQSLNSLFMTALNSDDLRVRAAAIEIDLACRNLEKSAATVDRLEHDARFGEQGPRANALWDIALLGNRGIEPEPRCPDRACFHPRSKRKHPILGSGRISVPRHGRNHRSAPAGFPRRPIADDPRAGRLRAGAVRDVERKAAPQCGASVARLRGRCGSGSGHAQVGFSGVARHHRTKSSPRFCCLEKLVQLQRRTLGSRHAG
jgi:hypothetical protein